MSEFLPICELAARAGGRVLLDWRGRFHFREKAPKDLVTEADLASQQAIRDVLLAQHPDHAFLGEEDDGQLAIEAPYRWIVDPLDGTMNYVHGVPQFCVSVALEHEGKLLAATVYDPCLEECFTASAGGGAWLNGARIRASKTEEIAQAMVAASFAARVEKSSPDITRFVLGLIAARGMRRGGSAAINLAYIAAGRYDAYWAAETKAWDIAAGVLLIREAGGMVTGLDGSELSLLNPQFLAASTPALHRKLLELFGDTPLR